MTSDITSLLNNFKKHDNRISDVIYKNTPKAEQALQIMNDIKKEKIKLKITNPAHVQVSQAFSELFYWYERNRGHYPFPEYLSIRIIAAYDSALSFGMIEKIDDEKTNLKKELISKDKEIEFLKKELEQARKDLEGLQDKDIPTFKSEIEEN